MKLIVLYGPPGAGKLTVAQALGKKTKYRILHNHLTIELLCSLFDWGSKPYVELIHKYRFEMLEVAAKYKLKGVIVTFVYAAEADDKEMRDLLRRMKKWNVRVCFVQLLPSQSELERRIKHESRKKFTKIRHVKNLRSLMKKYDTLKPIPYGDNLVIDNTKLSPTQAAQKIIQYFRLT